jgi:hypothetical protein
MPVRGFFQAKISNSPNRNTVKFSDSLNASSVNRLRQEDRSPEVAPDIVRRGENPPE